MHPEGNSFKFIQFENVVPKLNKRSSIGKVESSPLQYKIHLQLLGS